MTRLTILIPCVGDPVAFEDTLASVLQNRPGNSRVVVALDGPYDDPYELSGEVDFLEYPGRSDVVALVNATLPDVRSEFVHVLHCGIEVHEGWCDAALECFDEPDVATVAPLWKESGAHTRYVFGETWTPGGRTRRVTRRRPRLRARDTILTPTLAAGFFRREWLEATEGWIEDVPTPLAAVATGLVWRELGGRAVVAMESQVKGTWSPTLASSLAVGRASEHLRRQHRAQMTAGRLRRLASRLREALGESSWARRLGHGLGQCLGRIDRGIERRYEAYLAEVRNRQPSLEKGGTVGASVEDVERVPLRRAA